VLLLINGAEFLVGVVEMKRFRYIPLLLLFVITLQSVAEEAAEQVKQKESRVQKLILQLTNKKHQQRAVKELESIGILAAPTIIKFMDDRRPVGMRNVEFLNKAENSFEGIRVYKPELVVDLLAGLLNQITGTGFGDIYSGGYEFQRAEVVYEWRKWCLQHLGKSNVECGCTEKNISHSGRMVP